MLVTHVLVAIQFGVPKILRTPDMVRRCVTRLQMPKGCSAGRTNTQTKSVSHFFHSVIYFRRVESLFDAMRLQLYPGHLIFP